MRELVRLHVKWIFRDRILQALIVSAVILMAMVPVFSSFSMRQSQEVAITLSLSFISFVQLTYAIILGSTLIWRDIERKYTFSVLSLPVSRAEYVVAKFLAISVFLWLSSLIIGICAVVSIKIGAMQYQSSIPLQWSKIFVAIFMTTLKYHILTAITLLVSTVSTSFFMPFFTSIAIFLAGSGAQDVYEYILSENGKRFGELARTVIKTVYHIIPNFASFDYLLYAVYPIPLDAAGIAYAVVYAIIWCAMSLSAAVILFSRREMT